MTSFSLPSTIAELAPPHARTRTAVSRIHDSYFLHEGMTRSDQGRLQDVAEEATPLEGGAKWCVHRSAMQRSKFGAGGTHFSGVRRLCRSAHGIPVLVNNMSSQNIINEIVILNMPLAATHKLNQNFVDRNIVPVIVISIASVPLMPSTRSCLDVSGTDLYLQHHSKTRTIPMCDTQSTQKF